MSSRKRELLSQLILGEGTVHRNILNSSEGTGEQMFGDLMWGSVTREVRTEEQHSNGLGHCSDLGSKQGHEDR